jgi:putative transposase
MFNRAIANHPMPKRISTDHDPLFRFHRWLANLRVREIEEIKSVPYAPVSHPFVERLIGTIDASCWTARSSGTRPTWCESSMNSEPTTTPNAFIVRFDGVTPTCRAGNPTPIRAVLASYRWQSHCRGLFQTPQHA